MLYDLPVIRTELGLWNKTKLMKYTSKKFNLTLYQNGKDNQLLSQFGIHEFSFHNQLCDITIENFKDKEKVTLKELDNFLVFKYKELLETEYEKLFKSDMKKHIDAIATKYIIPGVTSNQAIMFLPAEAILSPFFICISKLFFSPEKNLIAPLNFSFCSSFNCVILISKTLFIILEFSHLNSKILFATIFTSSSSRILNLPSTNTILSLFNTTIFI